MENNLDRLLEDELNPIELIVHLMEDHKLEVKDMADILSISEEFVVDILNYKIGLSEAIISRLCFRFKLRESAFNRPYKLQS